MLTDEQKENERLHRQNAFLLKEKVKAEQEAKVWFYACAERDKRIAELERKSDQDDETILWQAKEIADKIDRIAELEERNRDLYEDVQRFKGHALNEKAARLELERQLEESRKDALEEAAVECDKRAHAGDAGALMAARAIRALKGAKE